MSLQEASNDLNADRLFERKRQELGVHIVQDVLFRGTKLEQPMPAWLKEKYLVHIGMVALPLAEPPQQ